MKRLAAPQNYELIAATPAETQFEISTMYCTDRGCHRTRQLHKHAAQVQLVEFDITFLHRAWEVCAGEVNTISYSQFCRSLCASE